MKKKSVDPGQVELVVIDASQYSEFSFGHWTIHYDPSEDEGMLFLYDNNNDELLGNWISADSMRMDIQYSPVGDEMSEVDWQQLWDWSIVR